MATLCEQHRIRLATLYRILDEHHVPRRRPSRQRTPEHVQARIAQEYQAGETVKAIAERHGVSHGTVSNIGRRHYRQRRITNRHDELVELAVAWLLGDEQLTATERDALNRIGLVTRLPGLRAMAHVDPELQPAIAERLARVLTSRWPTRTRR
ncbi:MAG: helix-turn-helix domain-containing protein [Acidimicrobiales bacterium]